MAIQTADNLSNSNGILVPKIDERKLVKVSENYDWKCTVIQIILNQSKAFGTVQTYAKSETKTAEKPLKSDVSLSERSFSSYIYMLYTEAIISLANFLHHSKLAETARPFSVNHSVAEVSPVSSQSFIPVGS